MISKIKKIIFGDKAVEIRTASTKSETISYFRVLHPFLTRKEITKLMSNFYANYCNKPTANPLVFEEIPSLFEKIKNFFTSKKS